MGTWWRSCSVEVTKWSGIDNLSKYGRVTKSYDDHRSYTFVEGDARDVDLMTKLLWTVITSSPAQR